MESRPLYIKLPTAWLLFVPVVLLPYALHADRPAEASYHMMERGFVLSDPIDRRSATRSFQGEGVLTDFEDGSLSGWTVVGDGKATVYEEMGNPGTSMRVDDDASGNQLYAIAPRAYLGDWSGASLIDSLTFDLYQNRTSGTFVAPQRMIALYGPGGVAWGLLGSQYLPVDRQWNRYVIRIDPAEWSMRSGNWEDLIQRIDRIELTAEHVNGGEWVLLDNIGLSFAPSVLPLLPPILSEFDSASFEGWIFENTAAVSIQNTGGNPGGYLRIGDRAGVLGTALAPPAYLGDWRQLDGKAVLQVDLNVVNHSGSIEVAPYLIRLSGAGGSASVQISSADVAAMFARWKTFSFMIREDVWQMESGSWADLMEEVAEVRIVVEFINGNDTIGLDNVLLHNYVPHPMFTADRMVVFEGDSVRFTDRSRFSPSSWVWSFGDGGSATGPHPVHYFNTPGIFDVSLEAANLFGAGRIDKPKFITVRSASDSLLFDDSFSAAPIHPAWVVGPSQCNWIIQSGRIAQTTNHFGATIIDACYALVGSSRWADYVLDTEMRSTDNDGIGVVFRYQDAANFYLFYWRAETNERALKRVQDGAITDLAADAVPYAVNTAYRLRVTADGNRLRVEIDGEAVFDVEDDTFRTGKAGLYCWANQSSFWDTFSVVNLDYIRVDVEEGPPFAAMEVPALHPNYPNPFAGRTVLAFELDAPARVTLSVYDLLGRRVETVLDERRSAGRHEVSWAARGLSAGVYLLRLDTENGYRIIRMNLLPG